MSHSFFPSVISLLFYVGILLISDVSASVVQIHTIQLCVDVYLFSLCSFSQMSEYGVFISFLMLFSSYFLIIYLMYVTVYILIPNS